MFAVFLVISLLFVAYGVVLMLNVKGGAEHIARSYGRLPRWYPKFGSDNPKVLRAGGSVALGFGAALLLVDLIKFR